MKPPERDAVAAMEAGADALAGSADTLQQLLSDWRRLEAGRDGQAGDRGCRAPLVIALRNLAQRARAAARLPPREPVARPRR